MGIEIDYDAVMNPSPGKEIYGIRYTIDRPYAIFRIDPFESTQTTTEYAILSRDTREPNTYIYRHPDKTTMVGNFAGIPLFANMTFDAQGHFSEGTFWRSFAVGESHAFVQAGLTYMKNRKVRPHYANPAHSSHNSTDQPYFLYDENPPFVEMHDAESGEVLMSLLRTESALELRTGTMPEPRIVRFLAVSYQMRELHHLLSGDFDEAQALAFPKYFDSAHTILFGKV